MLSDDARRGIPEDGETGRGLLVQAREHILALRLQVLFLLHQSEYTRIGKVGGIQCCCGTKPAMPPSPSTAPRPTSPFTVWTVGESPGLCLSALLPPGGGLVDDRRRRQVAGQSHSVKFRGRRIAATLLAWPPNPNPRPLFLDLFAADSTELTAHDAG
jgi:hypothetical protein